MLVSRLGAYMLEWGFMKLLKKILWLCIMGRSRNKDAYNNMVMGLVIWQ